MKKTGPIFLCTIAFLFMMQVITGGLGLQKGSSFGYFASVEDWSEETSEEDDSKTDEDYFAFNDVIEFTADSLSQGQGYPFKQVSFKEHITEIISPPPQA